MQVVVDGSGLRDNRAAMSALVTNPAMCCSCGMSWLRAEGSRMRKSPLVTRLVIPLMPRLAGAGIVVIVASTARQDPHRRPAVHGKGGRFR